MKQSKLIEIIEKVAPPAMQAPWDASGMQVAASKDCVTRLAVCLDPVPAAVEAAAALGADMILSHHPLLLKPRLPSVIDGYHRVLSLLFKNDLALYAAHTSLDVNSAGPAAWLADELALANRVVLEGTNPAAASFGFGICGDLPEPAPFENFARHIGAKCALSSACACGPKPDLIRSVAICPGSGSSLIDHAARLGADIFITGDVKHHAALETPVCILDVGHHSLEEEMMRRFSLLLQQSAPEISVSFIPSTSPFTAFCF